MIDLIVTARNRIKFLRITLGKAILTLIVVVLLCGFAHASPFFTSRPYPKGEEEGGDVGVPNQPFEFVVNLDALPAVSPAVPNPDGKVKMWFDLKDVSVGSHILKAAARNVAGASVESGVLTFTKACGSATCKYVYTVTEGSTKYTVTVTVPIEGQFLGLKGKPPLAVEYQTIVELEGQP